MSLKAKIEAVIYASEEPVTLAQLVGLLGEEAQAELDREAADQRTLLQEEELEAAEAEPSLGPDFDSVGAAGDGDAILAEESIQPTQDDETVLNGVPESGADEAAAAKAEKARLARLRSHFCSVLDQLMAEYAVADRGLEIRE